MSILHAGSSCFFLILKDELVFMSSMDFFKAESALHKLTGQCFRVRSA